jgi:hypothetical protein
MADRWMPGAERRRENNGSNMVGGPPRAVWHITWDELGPGGKMPSFDAIADYLQRVNYCPHLMWNPWTGKVVQFYPADQAARALENHAGGVETNRMGSVCIQVEVFFSPGAVVGGKKYKTVAETPCKGMDKIVDWMREWGVPDRWPEGWPRWTGNSRSSTTWRRQAGHYGHCNVPENEHTDPGPMPKSMFAEPVPEEEPVRYYGQLNNGPAAVTPISLHPGDVGSIGFVADNGILGKPPVRLRVAVHDTKGWYAREVTVDSTKPKPWFEFRDDRTTDGVSVVREDDGSVPVAWDAS